MSSDRIERKRRSEFDISDNSADEIPAVKVRKLDSEIGIGEKVSKACKNLLNWITPEFFKRMAVRIYNSRSSSSLNMGAENRRRNQLPYDVEEDDDNDSDECEILCDVVQNGTGAFPRSASADISKMDLKSKDSRTRSSRCSSRALKRPESADYDDICRYLESKRANGYPVGAREIALRSKQNEKSFAPVTKSRGEFQMLLDIDKDGDVEIIQEVFPAKQSSGPVRKARLQAEARIARNGRMNSLCDITRSSGARSPYLSRSYTANEVVRLQERAQYSLLLEKVLKRGPIYRPAYPKKDPPTSAIQVDLTEEDDIISSQRSHLKDAKVAQNMDDFIRKFCEPYEDPYIVKLRSHKNSSLDDEDDEVQIIDYPDIPTLKPRTFPKRSCSFFSNEWIAEMRDNIQIRTEELKEHVLADEERLERLRKRREAKEAEEKKKREELRLAGFVFPEELIEVAEEVFPEITPEMNFRIDEAITYKEEHAEVVITKVVAWNGAVEITGKDLFSLTGMNWLNDSVMSAYFALIQRRSELDGYPSVMCLNTFHYSKFKQSGYNAVRRWTKKKDIFSYDLLFMPLHLNCHWALLVLDNRTKVMTYYDSLDEVEQNWRYYTSVFFSNEMRTKKNMDFDKESYTQVAAKEIPKQMNSFDCGMFALKYAEYLSREAPLTFSQENMPYFRRRMIYELLTQQIL